MAFLSHSHADRGIVDGIYEWLAERAGIPIWYDSKDLDASEDIITALPRAIKQSRAMILLLSNDAMSSGWVKKEYGAAENEKAIYSDYRIIAIRIDDCPVPLFLSTTNWIDAPDGKLDLDSATSLILALYGTDSTLHGANHKDIYTAAGWRHTEDKLNTLICSPFIASGFRLIGDARDQAGFRAGDRVKSIMESCGALLAILPHRGDGLTSPYILREMSLGLELGIHVSAFLESGVDLHKSIIAAREKPSNFNITSDIEELSFIDVPVDVNIEEVSSKLADAVYVLEDEWREPVNPHYVFLARSYKHFDKNTHQSASRIIERVTAMRCVSGDDIETPFVQETIRERIRKAFVVVADISGNRVNACVEAGIASGADVPLHLIKYGKRGKPPFMFRDQQIWHYQDEVDMIARLHKSLRQYRRRVINNEIPSSRRWAD